MTGTVNSGRSNEERNYRYWCLENHLFLNPLNELIKTENAFAYDPLIIRSFLEDADHCENNRTSDPPRWFAMLNQLKEEYIYARYLCFNARDDKDKVHFADRKTSLSLGGLDYGLYSIRIEGLKTAFKTLYSMLDQISFFVNEFWNLGLKEREADARHVYKLHNYSEDNIVLTGFRWVLSEFNEDFGKEVNEADEVDESKGTTGTSSQKSNEQQPKKRTNEKNLSNLRNALEHKFVKVHDMWDEDLKFEDDHFYHISEENLRYYIHIAALPDNARGIDVSRVCGRSGGTKKGSQQSDSSYVFSELSGRLEEMINRQTG